MSKNRISTAVCAVVGDLFVNAGSHASLDALFEAVGASGPPPQGAHHSKWRTWLIRTANDPSIDSLDVFGQLLSQFMDLPPEDTDSKEAWQSQRDRTVRVLEENGFRYYRGGRLLPNGEIPPEAIQPHDSTNRSKSLRPSSIEELALVLVKGLPRAMHPLTHRRSGALRLTFESEYDIQDLLHALLRPWVGDIRPEEYTPSYAGSSTRMDFLLPAYKLVLELKLIRDSTHGKKIGNELIVDIEHYRRHPRCDKLWCVVYDPNHFIPNPSGLVSDLEGVRTMPDGAVDVKVIVLAT